MKKYNALIVFWGLALLLLFQFSFIRIDSTSTVDFDWDDLSDTNHFEILYLHVNNKTYPNKQFVDKYVEHYIDSFPEQLIRLNNVQKNQLLKFVSNSTNYSSGEQSIFHLNAGFIFKKNNQVCATINIGCGFNQLHFSPDNKQTKYGLLNDIGFRRLENLISSIKTI